MGWDGNRAPCSWRCSFQPMSYIESSRTCRGELGTAKQCPFVRISPVCTRGPSSWRGTSQPLRSTKSSAVRPIDTAAVMYAQAATHIAGYFTTSCFALHQSPAPQPCAPACWRPEHQTCQEAQHPGALPCVHEAERDEASMQFKGVTKTGQRTAVCYPGSAT